MVLAQQALDLFLDRSIELHKGHIGYVAREQANAFKIGDVVIQEEDDEHDQAYDVKGHVPKEGPPGEVEDLPGEDGTHPDDKQDVEDGRAHDGADAHVAVGDEDPDDRGEELGGGASGCHEGGPGHIV